MFKKMDYIYAIYKTGSFSKAAEQLFISQPALSIAVRKLEDELGQKLFFRTTGTVELTEAGKAYIDKCEKIRQFEQELTEYFNELDGLLTGELSIGGANISMNYILPDIITAFSAAYAIGCSASRLLVSRTGGVGSIGVIAMHVDQTARDAQQGYRYTPITAGDHKNDFSPHEKLGPEAHARLQAEVDRLYAMFVDHVAVMRKLDTDAVRATEAGIYFGMDAVTAGLADAVGSLDAVLAEFSSFLVARQARGHTMSDSTRLSAAIPSTLMENSTMPLTAPVDQPLTDEPVTSAAPDADKPVADEASPATTDASRADAVAIAELCQLAGHPELTAAFLAEGVSEAHVRKALLASRADSPEIRSTIAPDTAPPQQSQSAANPLMAAVKKLTGKE